MRLKNNNKRSFANAACSKDRDCQSQENEYSLRDLGHVPGMHCEECGDNVHLVINTFGFYDFSCQVKLNETPRSKIPMSEAAKFWARTVASLTFKKVYS